LALGLEAEPDQQLIDIWRAVEYSARIADSKLLKGATCEWWLTTLKNRLSPDPNNSRIRPHCHAVATDSFGIWSLQTRDPVHLDYKTESRQDGQESQPRLNAQVCL